MNSLDRTHYGYEYVCPLSGHIDYVGIGNAASHTDRDSRMKSHLRLSSNKLLSAKLDELTEKGIAPRYKKVVEHLSRLDACKWEATRIFELGTAATGTGPLFNLKPGEINFLITSACGSMKTFNAHCRYHGFIVDTPTLTYRIVMGWTPQAAAKIPPNPVSAFGQRFENLQSLHADTRCIVPYEALIIRVFKGENPERAATRPLEWACAWGQRFPGMRALSEDPRCFSDYDHLVTEVKRGCQHQAAAVCATGPVAVKGIVFANVDALVESPKCAVSRDTLLRRIQRESWAVERAVTEPLHSDEPFNGSSARGRHLCGHRACKKKAQEALRLLTDATLKDDKIDMDDWTYRDEGGGPQALDSFGR